jgi:signal transduction histidine kinase
MICSFLSKPVFLFFTSDTSNLIYYSHFTSLVVSLIILFFILYSGNKSNTKKLFAGLITSFVVWVIFNLILWTNNYSQVIIFFWSFFGILAFVISYLSYLLFRSFVFNFGQSIKQKIFFLFISLPIFIITPTIYNLKEFNLVACGIDNEGFFPFYYYFIAFIFLFLIIFELIKNRDKIQGENKKPAILFSLGIIFFMFSFFTTSFLSSYLVDVGVISDFGLEQYGLFGMTAFLSIITYLIVRFKAFDIKLIGSQALVVGMVILIGSQFFFVRNNTNRVLTAITLLVSTIMGVLIVKSVKKEVFLREKIEILAGDLERANSNLRHYNAEIKSANEKLKELDQLKTEFVGLATHQIRGPLTAIKGYLSMIIEGDYGKITKPVSDALHVVFSSAESLSVVVSDFLNVSRIEQGQMKYDMADFDIRELVEGVSKELRPNIDAKGLELKLNITKEECKIHGDKEKIKQVVYNLIDNSSKYTKQGWLSIELKKTENDKVLLKISDSGVGITPETLLHLFEKFSRAKDAFKTNILGTGLGLYVAKKMMEAHKGKIWAESEGEGKGSQFYVEFELKK